MPFSIEVKHHDDSCWDRCKASNWNPKNWDLTAKKVAQYAGIILAICIVASIVSALMVQYPQASGAFFTIFGVIGSISIIALIVGLVKHHQKNKTIKLTV